MGHTISKQLLTYALQVKAAKDQTLMMVMASSSISQTNFHLSLAHTIPLAWKAFFSLFCPPGFSSA